MKNNNRAYYFLGAVSALILVAGSLQMGIKINPMNLSIAAAIVMAIAAITKK